MTIKDEIKWFKEQFATEIIPSLAGTPISLDLACAIAFQESGELWNKLRLHLPRNEVLRLSFGDTLDAPSRSAFPRNKDALIATPNGQRIFELAHQLLIEMADATGIEAYQDLATRPHKFVHGYGIFQYDLQFSRRDCVHRLKCKVGLRNSRAERDQRPYQAPDARSYWRRRLFGGCVPPRTKGSLTANRVDCIQAKVRPDCGWQPNAGAVAGGSVESGKAEVAQLLARGRKQSARFLYRCWLPSREFGTA